MREILISDRLPKPRYRYNSLIKAGPFYQTAGMIALDVESGLLESGGVQAETIKILENLTQALPDFGLSLEDLIIVRIYTTDFDNFPLINLSWEKKFNEDIIPPARTAVGVNQLPLAASVEMEFTFYKNASSNFQTLP